MPNFAIRWGGVPAIDTPSSLIAPDVIGNSPVTQLNAVVLPAPLGPIIERISPVSRVKLTFDTASRPPNRLVRLSSSRSGTSGDSLHGGEGLALFGAFELDASGPAREQPTRT